MRQTLALRMMGLAALALIAAVIALAVVRDGSHSANGTLPTPAGPWYSALAAPAALPSKPRHTACGNSLNAKTLGVANPVLPCNVKIYIEYGNKRVLTAVIDRASSIDGPDFHLTKALADSIGLHGRQPIHWRYATDIAPG